MASGVGPFMPCRLALATLYLKHMTGMNGRTGVSTYQGGHEVYRYPVNNASSYATGHNTWRREYKKWNCQNCYKVVKKQFTRYRSVILDHFLAKVKTKLVKS
jgi:CRISPR/Cas system-associated exonuclease Cas4 (RecB family)